MQNVVQFPARYFLLLNTALPCFAFFFCIGVTILKDWARSTGSSCDTYNFLPSISASITYFYPQRFAWNLCFALNSTPRYMVNYIQMQRRIRRLHIAKRKFYRLTQLINGGFHFLELTSLLTLTYVSFTDFPSIHGGSFIVFVIFSLLHMFFTMAIDYMWPYTAGTHIHQLEKKLRAKRLRWFILNISSVCIMFYFYVRHSRFCEPNMYSMFCLFEYFVVLTNIAYHAVVIDEWDRDAQIQFWC